MMDVGRVAVAGTWAAAVVAVAVVLVRVPGAAALPWLALTAGLAVALAMAGQLVGADRSGFVARLAAASSGAFAVVAVGALLAVVGA